MSLASWFVGLFARKTLSATTSNSTGFVDAYHRQREPSMTELTKSIKATAWACANINASTCASHPPRLYVRTREGESAPKCKTRPLDASTRKALGSVGIEEVTEHPLLTLFEQVNPAMNSFDLWELTQLYLEVTGLAYWYIERGLIGQPINLWLIPSPLVLPHCTPGSEAIIDYWIYRNGQTQQRFEVDEIIQFRMPNLIDPYRNGTGPFRAAWQQVQLASEFASFKVSKFMNHAIPDALISPDEVMGLEERDRLERQWNAKMRRGGAGRVLIAESKMHLELLSHSMGDAASLADLKATREEIAFCFGIPQPYVSGETNLANMQAAETQHARLTIRPRLHRRDEKINEQLVPLFDTSGRLFVWTPDPVPRDLKFQLQKEAQDLRLGKRTINECRADEGLPPVPWGDTPFITNMHTNTNQGGES